MVTARVPTGVVVATDVTQCRRPLLEVIGAAIAGGARTILLRERELARAERLTLARAIAPRLARVGGRLIVAGRDPLGFDAVHLAAGEPMPVPRPTLVGRSCHRAAEVTACVADYATLSPIYRSASKPGYGPPLGVDALARLAAAAARPVLALGGIEAPDRVHACRAAGAAGVVVMGAVMRARDPAGLVAALLDAWASGGAR